MHHHLYCLSSLFLSGLMRILFDYFNYHWYEGCEIIYIHIYEYIHIYIQMYLNVLTLIFTSTFIYVYVNLPGLYSNHHWYRVTTVKSILWSFFLPMVYNFFLPKFLQYSKQIHYYFYSMKYFLLKLDNFDGQVSLELIITSKITKLQLDRRKYHDMQN
jgi:hypothetical protein